MGIKEQLANRGITLESASEMAAHFRGEPVDKKSEGPKGAKREKALAALTSVERRVVSSETEKLSVRASVTYVNVAKERGVKMSNVINDALHDYYVSKGWL